MSTLNGAAVVRAEVSIPRLGAWSADLVLAATEVPSGAVVLAVGDLELHGTVSLAGLDAPGKVHVSVVGGAGWDRDPAAPISHQSDGGVRLSTVLADLAKSAGQAIEQPTDRTIGERFAAPAGTRHRDVLAVLQRAGYVPPWRVDPDGVTRFGARVGTPVTARATELHRDAGLGVVTLGVDSPASFLPGNTLEDGSTIERLNVRETSGKLEVDAWVSSNSIRASIRRMVAEALLYSVPRTYVVAVVRDDGRLDLVPPPDASYLPELEAAEQWSTGGAVVTPEVGAEVTVIFRDGDATRYVVAGWKPGTVDKIELADGDRVAAAPGDEEGKGIAYGDTVQMFLGTGMTPTPVKLMRVGSLIDLTGNPTAPVSKVEL